MHTLRFCLLFSLLSPLPLRGQTPASPSPTPQGQSASAYGLKGDTIGETLQDFRNRNHAIIPVDSYTINGTTKVDKVYPRCSGDIAQDPEPQAPAPNRNNKKFQEDMAAYQAALQEYRDRYDATQKILDREVAIYHVDKICFVTDAPTIAGARATLRYMFDGGRLDRIFGSFDRAQYALVRDAIVAKYGPPTSVTVNTYSNKMGGSINGEVALWTQSSSVVRLREVSPNNMDVTWIFILNPATAQAEDEAVHKKANSDF